MAKIKKIKIKQPNGAFGQEIPIGVDATNIDTDASHRLVSDNQINTWTNQRVASSTLGAKNGVATLDGAGKVPSSQLPSYVDDVLEYSTRNNFPAKGETGKIYVATDTNKTYRWSGSSYTVISETLSLGTTSSTAYRGDLGSTAYNHSQVRSGNPHKVTKADVGLGNVDNTADSNKSVKYANTAGSAKANDVYDWAKASTKPSYSYSEVGAAPASHSHDDRYYTESEINSKLGAKLNTSGGTISGDLTVNKYLNVNSWPGYGTGTGKLWYNANEGKLKLNEKNIIVEGDSRLTNSRPASDVYSWAKASAKPSYSKSEVGLSNVDNTADVNKSVKYAASAGSAGSATNATNASLATSIKDAGDGRSLQMNYSANEADPLYFASWTSSGVLGTSNASQMKKKLSLSKTDVGLSNVDNTADSSKSVNYANTAGSAKASDVYSWAKASTKPSYSKSEVGLGNVENKSSATIRNEITSGNVTNALGFTPVSTSSFNSLNNTVSSHSTKLKGLAPHNLLINGDFQCWQRGDKLTLTNGKYGPDMWKIYTGNLSASITIQKVNDGLKVVSVSGVSQFYISQRIDQKYAGKSISFTVCVNGTPYVRTITADKNYPTIGLNLSSGQVLNYIDFFEDSATGYPHKKESYGIALSRCQEYVYGLQRGPLGMGFVYWQSGNQQNGSIFIHTPISMHSHPTLEYNDVKAFASALGTVITNKPTTLSVTESSSDNCIELSFSFDSGAYMFIGQGVMFSTYDSLVLTCEPIWEGK